MARVKDGRGQSWQRNGDEDQGRCVLRGFGGSFPSPHGARAAKPSFPPGAGGGCEHLCHFVSWAAQFRNFGNILKTWEQRGQQEGAGPGDKWLCVCLAEACCVPLPERARYTLLLGGEGTMNVEVPP